MSKHHDSLLFMVLYRETLDRLCVRLNMYLVSNQCKEIVPPSQGQGYCIVKGRTELNVAILRN